MNRKIFQIGIFLFFIFAFLKPKLSLNRSKMVDPLRFDLTVLYCIFLNFLTIQLFKRQFMNMPQFSEQNSSLTFLLICVVNSVHCRGVVTLWNTARFVLCRCRCSWSCSGRLGCCWVSSVTLRRHCRNLHTEKFAAWVNWIRDLRADITCWASQLSAAVESIKRL